MSIVRSCSIVPLMSKMKTNTKYKSCAVNSDTYTDFKIILKKTQGDRQIQTHGTP